MNKTGLYLVIGCVALSAQIVLSSGLPTPDLDEQTLQSRYHIAPTKEGLIGALQHQSRDVRNFAAMKLANDGEKDAIGPILAALAAETVEGVKVNQATSAARLGSAEGFKALKNMCADRTWSPPMRMVAAQSMMNFLGRQECLPDMIDVLRSAPDDSEAPAAALRLFPKFKQVPPSQLDEIRNLTAMYLKGRNPVIRMIAIQCVRDLGGPWAISQLRTALQAEQDETVRGVIAKALSSVRQ